ncbi:hypothetical protein COV24_02770 [candidate division WWE3 bacterium CG10_big_fil_rev_8_21_14_0_10_32_10]|uniref:Resuscitation-promoting factor core lysozyme-like domain-containing protein n=1 Tax=candidate division WWE3 bacterium CG10_big_fil_rev_8_21_14_0_10_32_10 TaxID=1975090 RepID=A0A2H0RA87_UNCKA|nr:MAG: hypothetical protein COV24_02770 [candidate division WWE3 bacterium CG10_big_fil_rev_8_21_14_0_10_32_10]
MKKTVFILLLWLITGLILMSGYSIGNKTINQKQLEALITPAIKIETVLASEEKIKLIVLTPTPTPPPVPTPIPTILPTTPVIEQPSNEKLNDWFEEFSTLFNINKDILMKIAKCESNYNADSHNIKYDYAGMYQFSKGTWESARYAMGEDPKPDLRFNPKEAIKTAAFKISKNGIGAWPNCN